MMLMFSIIFLTAWLALNLTGTHEWWVHLLGYAGGALFLTWLLRRRLTNTEP